MRVADLKGVWGVCEGGVYGKKEAAAAAAGEVRASVKWSVRTIL